MHSTVAVQIAVTGVRYFGDTEAQRLGADRHAVIAREGEQHPAGRGDGGQAAEQLRDQDADVDAQSSAWPQVLGQDRVHRPEEHVQALCGTFVHVRDWQA